MRHIILAIALVLSAPAVAQVEFGPGGLRIGPRYERHEHYGYGGQCRELRRACMYKHELGEEGEGNCRRYREVCGR
jgi:hypothetical protein